MQAPSHTEFLLYLDDDADDREIFQDIFNKVEKDLQLVLLAEGEQVLELLSHAKITGNIPKLIILDLNMPGIDGREVLRQIRQDSVLSNLPVVIFTTSSSEMDKAFAAEHRAEFITKPGSVSALKTVIESIIEMASVT
ncbi:MAG: response regulator [Candidatus Dadabacteria bacterium]